VLTGLLVLLIVSVLLCGAASAAPTPTPPGPGTPTVNDLPTVIANARNWLIGISATLATFFLTLGAAQYMSARTPAQDQQAKDSLKAAAAGYALMALAPVLLRIVQGILGISG
jgi:hypothetical protein